MSLLDKLSELASKTPTTPVAPSAFLLAHTVRKVRNGEQVTTAELASVVNRLAHSPLSENEIADRFTDAFADVLISQE